jgi:hypothetical protein
LVQPTTVADLVALVKQNRALGNDAIRIKDLPTAARHYNAAIALYDTAKVVRIATSNADDRYEMAGHVLSAEDAALVRSELVFCYLNLAQCYLTQQYASKTITACEKVCHTSGNSHMQCHARYSTRAGD